MKKPRKIAPSEYPEIHQNNHSGSLSVKESLGCGFLLLLNVVGWTLAFLLYKEVIHW